MKYIKWI